MGWLSRLFGRGRSPAGPSPEALPAAAPPPPAAVAADAPPLLGWLLSFEARPPAQPAAGALTGLLETVDAALRRPSLPPELMPRSASVVPQLIALLRRDDLHVTSVAQRVAKEPAIAAEVLRLASNPYYRAQREVTDLHNAIRLVGADGVQTAIARVLLKPLYQGQPGGAGAVLAPQLWVHADVLSRHAAAAAAAAGATRFDGYLAGLLHDTGWLVLLRAFDRAATPLAALGDRAAWPELEVRAHRLFGLAAQGWDITPAFSALVADARRRPLASSDDPLAQALRAAHPPCMAELAPNGPELPAAAAQRTDR